MKETKFLWTSKEDDKLVLCLLELVSNVQWNTYNSFKPGFTLKLEELMEKKLSRYGIKVSPQKESRYKTLRRQYRAIDV